MFLFIYIHFIYCFFIYCLCCLLALIESTKAAEENIAVLEYLIRVGCMVNYITKKHRRAALHWARLLQRSRTLRILDLASVVQSQSNKVSYGMF